MSLIADIRFILKTYNKKNNFHVSRITEIAIYLPQLFRLGKLFL